MADLGFLHIVLPLSLYISGVEGKIYYYPKERVLYMQWNKTVSKTVKLEIVFKLTFKTAAKNRSQNLPTSCKSDGEIYTEAGAKLIQANQSALPSFVALPFSCLLVLQMKENDAWLGNAVKNLLYMKSGLKVLRKLPFCLTLNCFSQLCNCHQGHMCFAFYILFLREVSSTKKTTAIILHLFTFFGIDFVCWRHLPFTIQLLSNH